MNTKELFDAVVTSRQLELAVERFMDVNGVNIDSTETECFMNGYIEAVIAIHRFMHGNNQLTPENHEKQ